jgi:hypothetical protein
MGHAENDTDKGLEKPRKQEKLPSGDPAGGLKMRNDLAGPKGSRIDLRNPSHDKSDRRLAHHSASLLHHKG